MSTNGTLYYVEVREVQLQDIDWQLLVCMDKNSVTAVYAGEAIVKVWQG